MYQTNCYIRFSVVVETEESPVPSQSNASSCSVVDYTSEEFLNSGTLFEVVDLGITLDDQGLVCQAPERPYTASSCEVVQSQVRDETSTCPPDLALAALECSLSLETKQKYEKTWLDGRGIKDKIYETWKHYKQMVNK